MWRRLSPRERIAVWLIVTLAIFLALLLSVVGVVSLFTAQSRESGSVTFTYGVGLRRDPSVSGDRVVYMPNGVPYADFTRLSAAYPFSKSGNESEIRYVIQTADGAYDTVTFYYGSRKAIVNGTHITLSAPVRQNGTAVLVPCEFITSYMNGVTVTVTEGRIRVIYDEGKVSLKPSIDIISPVEIPK